MNPYRMSEKDLASGRFNGRAAFLAESDLLLEESSRLGLDIMSVLSTPSFGFPAINCAEKLLVSSGEFESITGYPQTRSAVGVVARPDPASLEDILSQSTRLVIVEDSTNGANLATIFRIAENFGIDGVLISHSCADPLFRRCARMSRGSVLRVPWARVGSCRQWAPEIVPQLHSAGFKLAALVLTDDSISLSDLPQLDKLALVMGTEGEGLMPQTVAACDLVVKIPMREGVDSLNVAAAAAVACWQATRC